MPHSGILEFGEWICKEDWSSLSTISDPTKQVLTFQNIIQQKVDLIFPQKFVKINPWKDLPFMNADLKKFNRLMKREYRKHSKSEKYFRFKGKYELLFQKAASDYLDKSVRTLMEDNPGAAYKCLKRLAAQPGVNESESDFTLKSHQDANLTSEQSLERIAQHFANISQEFSPLNISLLPPDVRANIESESDKIPIMVEHDVYQKIKKTKKPHSSVPGDLPRRLVQEFSPELAVPAAVMFQNITNTGQWPKSWKIEYGTPLIKEQNPETEDQLRIISLTNFLSKVYEQYVMQWLMVYVGDKLDWAQYGGEKGSSVLHYLIELVNFILYNQDMKIPHAVLAVMIDYSKAFNRINHNRIVTLLSNMGVPGWLLRIIIGFLTERELIVRQKGKHSQRKWLPGGSPQGTRLGLFLFLILINAAGYEHLEKQLGTHITKKKNKRQIIPNLHLKFVDDLSLAEAINVKESLLSNPDPNPPRPLAYHDRTLHTLPPHMTPMQETLNKMAQYCKDNNMKINSHKTRVALFNTSRKFDFMPQLSIDGSTQLEVVEKFRLLGVMFQTDLSWQANTDLICKKGFARLWILKRLKKFGSTNKELVDIYYKQIRCVLEQAVAVWTPNLTKSQSVQLERVQKCALHIIMGEHYQNYEQSRNELNVETLAIRRSNLCLKFARKAEKHKKYSKWFHPRKIFKPNFSTRSKKNQAKLKYTPVPFRKMRYNRSPIPFLTQLLNEYHSMKKV